MRVNKKFDINIAKAQNIIIIGVNTTFKVDKDVCLKITFHPIDCSSKMFNVVITDRFEGIST